MMPTMLVPLDGSPLAERALPYAEALARAADGRVVLVRVGDADDGRGAEGTAYLQAVAGALEARGVATEVSTPQGEAAEQIIAEAEARNAGLIAMATHGRDGLGALFSGSVAEDVLGRTTRPLLLIRADDDAPEPAPLPARPRILVPLDGTPYAEAILSLAHDLAKLLDGELVLLSVITPPPPPTLGGLGVGALSYADFDLEGARRESEEELRAVARRHGLDPALVRSDIWVGDAADGIAAALDKLDASLVAMATHARSGLGRLIFGDTATATLRETSVPLVVQRFDDLELAGSEQAQQVEERDPLAATAVNIA